ncbi:hypothetical protein DRJ25_06200 [Candidatus Woesearchaeota archaeon]|nr:MAG: hypothetical protein DRJ25_06200 [Candidatus Woesearchaeota archaeon]
MKTKKGATAGGAAALVAIIAFMIVLYILFLPPEERARILENRTEGGSAIVEGNVTLLLENPGRLDYIVQDEYEHDLPAFTLYKTTGAEIIKKENPFLVKNGWFDEKSKQVTFKIEDLDLVDNVILTFGSKKNKGVLIITLNGNTVFENEISSYNVEPVALPKEYLKEDNLLEFSVSGVGIRFWRTNEYIIENLQIIADVTDITRQESENVFTISAVEYYNLDTAKLKFNPECNPKDVGTLNVFVNNHKIFSGVPDCGIINTIEFPAHYLNQGGNHVVFRTDKGSYLVDQIKVKTKLKGVKYPFYSFEINDTMYEDVRNGKLDIELVLKFVDTGELKRANIYVNDGRFIMSTEESEFVKNINSRIVRGTNELEIVPDKSTLDIIELRVRAVEE